MKQDNYLANLSKNYVVMYIIRLSDGGFTKIGSIEEVEKLSTVFSHAQLLMNHVITHMVYPEFQEKMLRFVDLGTVKERLKEKEKLSCEYYGRHIGWCNAEIIPAAFDEAGDLQEIFFMVFHIQDHKLKVENYRRALESNASFVFQFDLTKGIIEKEFETVVHKLIPDYPGTFPINYDQFLDEYFSYVNAAPINGRPISYTRTEMLHLYQKGKSRFENQYYSELMKAYYSHEFFLTKNEENDHIIAMVVGTDISKQILEQRKNTEQASQILSRDFENVFWLNLSTGEVIPLKAAGYVSKKMEYGPGLKMSYIDSMQQYAQFRVAPLDRERYLQAMSIQEIQRQMAGNSTVSVVYQVVNEDGSYHTERVKISRTEEERQTETVLLAFQNIDALVEEERKHQKRLEESLHNKELAMTELRKSQIYMETISASYEFVIVYNLTKNTYNIVVNRDFLNLGSATQGVYTELLHFILRNFPEKDIPYQKEVRSIASQIKRYHSGKKFFEERHRAYDSLGNMHWIRERVIYMEDPNNADLLGISISTIIDKEVEHEQKENQITEALTKHFKTVFLINPRKDVGSVIKEEGYMPEGIISSKEMVIPYTESVKIYANERLCKEDRLKYQKALTAENIERELKDKDAFMIRIRALEKGEIHNYQARIIKTGEEGIYILGFENIDAIISEEQKKQQQLEAALEEVTRANEEVRQANNAKTDFLSRMSHDIRTPINGIVGMMHIMKAELDDKEKLIENIDKVEVLNRQLELLINDVLEMSRIERGKIELLHEPFELQKLLEDIGPAIQVMAENAGVRFLGSHYDMVHPCVVSSPVHIQRISMNILSNAIKYNQDGGTVECWVKEQAVDDTHSRYSFICKDTGLGMSDEFLQHLYEPFAREPLKLHTSVSGTGLGMAITKELVDLFGGTIDVKSEIGIGTTVTVTLPLELAEETVDIDMDDTEASIEGKRILLVEDNPLNLKIAKFVLEEQKMIVEVAKNGQEAIQMFSSRNAGYYTLILMDIMMPVMDGIEATKAIRALDKEGADTIPIVAMSANAFEEDKKKCIEAGMNDHISKPLDIDRMMETISKFSGGGWKRMR